VTNTNFPEARSYSYPRYFLEIVGVDPSRTGFLVAKNDSGDTRTDYFHPGSMGTKCPYFAGLVAGW